MGIILIALWAEIKKHARISVVKTEFKVTIAHAEVLSAIF
jgi:hypothetical protein